MSLSSSPDGRGQAVNHLVAASAGIRVVDWQETPTSGRFAGKTIVVTGAGGGIGRATLDRILDEGGRVIAVDLSAAGLESAAERHANRELEIVVGDVADEEVISAVCAAAGPHLDGLANIAGIMDDFSGLDEVSDETWDRVFRVNVFATMAMSRALLPSIIAPPAGSIVNIASEAGLRGSSAGVAYTASKHAVIGITRSGAYLYGPLGVRVNAVAPGAVETGMRVNPSTRFGSLYALGRTLARTMASPSQVAALVTFLLSDDAPNINGQVIASDGGWSAV